MFDSSQVAGGGEVSSGDLSRCRTGADADRDEVANLLSHAYAEGRITHEEHDERLQAAMAARTFGDLVGLTADLVPLDRPLPGAVPPQPRPGADLPTVDPRGATDEVESLTTVLSEKNRLDRWRVRRHIASTIVLGEQNLDMRNAVFDGTEIDISGFTVLGELNILVPEGVDVRDETTTFLAETNVRGLRPQSGGPVLTLRGTVVLGEINVRGPDARLGLKGWKFRRRR